MSFFCAGYCKPFMPIHETINIGDSGSDYKNITCVVVSLVGIATKAVKTDTISK